MRTFIEYLESKCIEDSHCIKDNFEEHWEMFLEDLFSDHRVINTYADDWRAESMQEIIIKLNENK